MALFYDWLGEKKSQGVGLAVMDMWQPFRNVTVARAPQAAILFDKFHIMRHLGKALDEVRKSEYRRLSGRHRSYIKGQKYTLLSHRENLTPAGRLWQGYWACRWKSCLGKRARPASVGRRRSFNVR